MAIVEDYITGVRAFLLADASVAALVSTRVYGVELPDSDAEVKAMPRKAVVLVPAGGDLLVGRRSYLRVSDPRMDVFSYGETAYETSRVDRAVRGALKQMRRNTQGTTMLYSADPVSTARVFRDPDTEWRSLVSTYTVLHSEVTI
jgi:hypothetical protein